MKENDGIESRQGNSDCGMETRAVENTMQKQIKRKIQWKTLKPFAKKGKLMKN